jgi:hypothetical protein
VQTRASNKKQANASCAVLAVRALFKNNLIEKFGDRIMNLSMNRQSESGVQGKRLKNSNFEKFFLFCNWHDFSANRVFFND